VCQITVQQIIPDKINFLLDSSKPVKSGEQIMNATKTDFRENVQDAK